MKVVKGSIGDQDDKSIRSWDRSIVACRAVKPIYFILVFSKFLLHGARKPQACSRHRRDDLVPESAI